MKKQCISKQWGALFKQLGGYTESSEGIHMITL